jgi:SH3 domain-containing YSC84-like protein 1
MAAGSLTLGGNMSLALGPLGRNGEASGSLNTNGKVAAMCVQLPFSYRIVLMSSFLCRYSYSKTRGLFGGVSVEGSVIMERQDANFQAYNSPVTARMLLGGTIEPPDWALPLIKTLEACTGMPGGREWINDFSGETSESTYAFGGTGSPGSRVNTPSFLQKKKKADAPAFPPQSWQSDTQSDSFSSPETRQIHSRNHTWDGGDYPFHSTSKSHTSDSTSQQKSSQSPDRSLVSTGSSFEDLANPFISSTNPFSRKSSMYRSTSSTSSSFPEKDDPFRSLTPVIKPREELARPLLPREGIGRAVAIYDFKAVEVVT